MKPRPLTDDEFERLSEILKRIGGERSMSLEQLDGFLAALVCGPDNVFPSEYLPIVLGENIGGEDASAAKALFHELTSLIFRHWNFIVETLRSGDVHLPLLLENENGIFPGNNWAIGFLRGMDLRREGWGPLLHDEERGGWIVPIFALAHEHDPDPEMRPYKDPVSAEQRETLIVGAAAAVGGIYRYFADERLLESPFPDSLTTFRRTMPRIGRNDPCPCGSGRKFKQCCGKTTLH